VGNPLHTLGRLTVWLGLAWGGLFLTSPLFAQVPRLRATFEGHTGAVRGLAISPDGKTIASGDNDNTIRIWDMASGKQLAVLKKAAVYGVDSLAFSPDGKTLASGNGGNTIKLWDVRTHKNRTLLDEVSEYAAPQVVFSADGKTLASGGACIQEIMVWDVTTGKQTAILPGHDIYGVTVMAITPDGKVLSTVGHDGAIKQWDVTTGKSIATRQLLEWTPAAAFSPDRKTLAAARPARVADDGTIQEPECIKLWDVATGKELATFSGKTASVWLMVFSPDGKTLACGGEDGTIKLWEVATGKEWATLKGHSRQVTALAFTANSRSLVSGCQDTTIKVWELVKPK
jgi:WD40 repeat protein